MMTSTQSAKRTKKTAMPPTLADISAVKLVPLHLIDILPQLRKEFDQESIEDLAHDIQVRGLLQPILLNPVGDRFQVIAGERRLRAVKHNGQDSVPALLVKATADEALLMQLAENIQRENLTLTEECGVIETLYEMLGSLEKVAETVKKSKSWCSKRFAMAQKGLWWGATRLIEEGITEDIELLKALTNLEKLCGWNLMQEWTEKIRKGEAGRNEIRAALKIAKQQVKEKKEKEAAEAEKISHAKPKKPPAPPEWTLDDALEKLESRCGESNVMPNATNLLKSFTEEQQVLIAQYLEKQYAEGKKPDAFLRIADIIQNPWAERNRRENGMGVLAMILAISLQPFEMWKFMEDLQVNRKTA